MEKLEWCSYPMVKKFEDMFICFDMIHERDRRTDTACRHLVYQQLPSIHLFVHKTHNKKTSVWSPYKKCDIEQIEKNTKESYQTCYFTKKIVIQGTSTPSKFIQTKI